MKEEAKLKPIFKPEPAEEQSSPAASARDTSAARPNKARWASVHFKFVRSWRRPCSPIALRSICLFLYLQQAFYVYTFYVAIKPLP